jgi:hypothetical protein
MVDLEKIKDVLELKTQGTIDGDMAAKIIAELYANNTPKLNDSQTLFLRETLKSSQTLCKESRGKAILKKQSEERRKSSIGTTKVSVQFQQFNPQKKIKTQLRTNIGGMKNKEISFHNEISSVDLFREIYSKHFIPQLENLLEYEYPDSSQCCLLFKTKANILVQAEFENLNDFMDTNGDKPIFFEWERSQIDQGLKRKNLTSGRTSGNSSMRSSMISRKDVIDLDFEHCSVYNASTDVLGHDANVQIGKTLGKGASRECFKCYFQNLRTDVDGYDRDLTSSYVCKKYINLDDNTVERLWGGVEAVSIASSCWTDFMQAVNEKKDSFGADIVQRIMNVRYVEPFLFKTQGENGCWYLVEKELKGKFIKFTSNHSFDQQAPFHLIYHTFMHFSMFDSDKKTLVCDIQGMFFNLT